LLNNKPNNIFFPGEGFKLVLSFRFDLHPRTLVIEESTLSGDPSTTFTNKFDSDEDLMFYGLSPLHVACVFDQVIKLCPPLPYTNLVHLDIQFFISMALPSVILPLRVKNK
jgi:hypothetical protein